MIRSQHSRFPARAFLIAAFIVACLSEAEACSCALTCKKPSDCIKEAYENSSVVFVGTPVDVTLQNGDDKPEPHSFSRANYRVRLRVKESFKGLTASEIVSDNGIGGGADCSYGKMEIGRDYLVYATLDEKSGEIGPTPCSRTRPINPAEPVSELPEPKAAVGKELSVLRTLKRKAASTH